MKLANRVCSADRRLIWLLAAWWILNVIQAAFTQPANDEVYYWLFARHLAWGYFDHPPMTALLVWLGSPLGGQLGIRFFSTLLQPIYLYIIWRLLRPARPETKDADLFFVICAALPILQLYGFIAVPDGPLMLFTALFLFSYQKFREKNTWASAIVMGITIAALAYSKYHGALVVLFTLLSSPRNFKNPKLYLCGAVALLLLVPHLWWQYGHDWASFRYHLAGRNGYFSWSDLTEFILNLSVIFNPLFVPLYIRAWRHAGPEPQPDIKKALYAIVVGFIGFFTLSSFRGYVQPQWVIPISFGLIMILFGYARRHPRTRRYVVATGWITVGLVCVVRGIMIFNPFGIRFEVFNNPESYAAIASVAQGRPVIFDGRYAAAAKYMYYTGGETYSQAQVGYRTSQWEYIDNDSQWTGREVVVQTTDEYADSAITLPNGKRFAWRTVKDFRPVRKVRAEITGDALPTAVRPGDTLRFEVRLYNPYDYAIDLSSPHLDLVLAIGLNKRPATELAVPTDAILYPASYATVQAQTVIPDGLKPQSYTAGLTLRPYAMGHWYNGRTYKVKAESPIQQKKRP